MSEAGTAAGWCSLSIGHQPGDDYSLAVGRASDASRLGKDSW